MNGVPPQAEPNRSQTAKTLEYIKSLRATHHATQVLSDLRLIDFRSEIAPIDQHTVGLMTKNFVFWSVCLLAVTPLLLVTFQRQELQITGLCLFFAAIWGVIFKRFIVEEEGSWIPPISALLFTGIVGLQSLSAAYKLLPKAYLNLSNHENLFLSLVGSVFQTGLFEELVKALPVGIYIWRKRSNFHPITAILIGVFSGLGFAAFENLGYVGLQSVQSAFLTRKFGLSGLDYGVKGAMINVVLRSISNVFVHAVNSGIFAYFITIAFVTKKRMGALISVGLLVSSILHGSYNWFWEVQSTLPAVNAVLGCMLFFAYLTKLRLMLAVRPLPSNSTETNIGEEPKSPSLSS
jgi:RsiW-degrading membrane proteinase PrsW (M82 family)